MMSEDVRHEALEEVERLSQGRLHGLIVYGSHIAGYARPDSDYDFIAIVDEFKEKIRYKYHKLPSGWKASLLLVDRETFERDVERAFLGEFVAGRLYGVYKPLLNEEYFLEQEKILKMRTISEELIDLCGEFELFLPNLLIPLRYFLFSKLKKRMALYPPVKYSYSKTFFGPQGEANTEFSMKMFREAAQELSDRNILELIEDKVKIINPQVTRVKIEDFLHHLNIFYRGMKSYFVHAWAGKVNPKVVISEFRSKISRAFKGYEIPEPLNKPYLFMGLKDPGIRFFYEEESLEEVVEETLGAKCEIIEKKKVSGVLSHLYEIVIGVDGEERSYAYKKFPDVGRLKWFPLELWALTAAEFSMSPKLRLTNEYTYNVKLSELGFNVPRVLAVIWSGKSLLMEYVEGTTLSDLLFGENKGFDVEDVMSRVGELFARLHQHKICLGDSKPQNILIDGEGAIYLTDLEQVNEKGNFAWDVSLLLFYSARFPMRKKRMLRAAEAFKKGYLEHGEAKTMFKSSSARYMRIFAPIVPPDTLKALIDLCRE